MDSPRAAPIPIILGSVDWTYQTTTLWADIPEIQMAISVICCEPPSVSKSRLSSPNQEAVRIFFNPKLIVNATQHRSNIRNIGNHHAARNAISGRKQKT